MKKALLLALLFLEQALDNMNERRRGRKYTLDYYKKSYEELLERYYYLVYYAHRR